MLNKSVMAGNLMSLQTRIKAIAPNVLLLTPCLAHKLNLVL